MTRQGLNWECEDVDSIRTSVAVSVHGGRPFPSFAR
jgi:hypothetical protein